MAATKSAEASRSSWRRDTMKSSGCMLIKWRFRIARQALVLRLLEQHNICADSAATPAGFRQVCGDFALTALSSLGLE